MLNLLCKVGWHHGTWAFDSGPVNCSQTRICRRCGVQSSKDFHNVEHWESIGSFTECGSCERCGIIVTRTFSRDDPVMISPGEGLVILDRPSVPLDNG